MNTPERDLGATLRTLLQEEVDAMDIDTQTATLRLKQELDQSTRQRRRRTTFATVAAVAAAGVGIALWNGPLGTDTTAPPAASPTPTPSAWANPSQPYFLDLASGEQTPLPASLVLENRGGIRHYAGSPNGTMLAVWMAHGEWYPIGIGNIDGTDFRTIGGTEWVGVSTAWSPDGAKLVYQAHIDGEFAGKLVLLDVATGDMKQLTDLDLSNRVRWLAPVFSADGKSVLFQLSKTSLSEQVQHYDVWSVPVSGGDPTKVMTDAATPMALPNDGGIAFHDTSDTGYLQIEAPDGSRRTVAPVDIDWDDYALSPDGTRIASLGGNMVFVLDIATGDVEQVAGYSRSVGWLGNDTLIIAP